MGMDRSDIPTMMFILIMTVVMDQTATQFLGTHNITMFLFPSSLSEPGEHPMFEYSQDRSPWTNMYSKYKRSDYPFYYTRQTRDSDLARSRYYLGIIFRTCILKQIQVH